MDKKTKAKNKKIKVSFIGNNAIDVTGSCTLIEYYDKNGEKHTILLECGLNQQGKTVLQQYKDNSRKFDFNVKNIDCVIIGHSHADHTGLLPLLYKRGYTKQVVVPFLNKDLLKPMLLDSAAIMERDVIEINKKHGKNYLPIYTAGDVYETLSHIVEYPMGEKIMLNEDVELQFVSSGHIFAAAQIVLWVRNNGNTKKKIVYTSDLGNVSTGQYYVNSFEPVLNANLLIGETTYGTNERCCTKKDREKDLEKIKSIVKQTCVDQKGKILFPSFSLHRSQTILTILYELFHNDEKFNVPILLDSPLAIKITDVFVMGSSGKDKDILEKVLEWPNIKICREFSQTEEFINSEKPCIFVSASGMMNNGRSKFVASKLLPHENASIVFCGYSVENSLAFKIKNLISKSITIDGKSIPIKANVISLKSFSSHMQHDDLLKYYSDGNYDKIALVHGNMDGKISFGKELEEQLSKKNKTGKITVVNKGTSFNL